MGDGSLVAANHKDELTILSSGFGSSNWRIDKAGTPGLNFFGKTLARAGRDGAGINDDHSGAQSVINTLWAKQDLLDCVGIRDTEPDNLGMGRGFLRGG